MCRHSLRISVSARGRGGGVGWNSVRSRTNFGMLVDATLLPYSFGDCVRAGPPNLQKRSVLPSIRTRLPVCIVGVTRERRGVIGKRARAPAKRSPCTHLGGPRDGPWTL